MRRLRIKNMIHRICLSVPLLTVMISCGGQQSKSVSPVAPEEGGEVVSGAQPNPDEGGSGGAPVIPPVSGNGGNGSSEVPPDITAPVVAAGADIVTNSAVTLTGAATDESPVQLIWSRVSGPGALTFGTPSLAETSVSGDTDGTYVIRLTATDSGGTSAFDELLLTIDTVAPSVNAGSDTSTPAGTISRTATASDTSTPLTISWTKQSGSGAITFSAPDTFTTDISAGSDEAFVIRATVVDAAGNSSFDEFTYTRVSAGAAVSAGSDKTTAIAVALAGSVDDGTGVTYLWSKISGPGLMTFSDATVLAPTASADTQGSYVLRVTATKNGNQTFDEMTFVWDTESPVVNAGADKLASAATNLVGTASDNLTPLSFTWSQTSGPGTCSFGTPSNSSTSVACDLDATYEIRLTATDGAGNSTFDELTMVWDENAPMVDAGADIADANGSASLNGTVTDGTAVTRLWTKVSGPGNVTFSNASFEDPTVTMDKDGIYVLRLTATDAVGLSSSDTVSVEWIGFSYDFNFVTLASYLYDSAKILFAGVVASLNPVAAIDPVDSEAEFEAAGFSATDVDWDNSAGGMALNAAGLTAQTGTYTSPVIDFGATTDVKRLSWTNPIPGPYQRGLPGNGQSDPVEWGADRITSMSDAALLFHFSEDAGTSTLTDASGNLKSTGGAMTATCAVGECPTLNYRGRIGRGVEFNGTNKSLTIPDDPANRVTGSLTIAAWMKVDNANFNYLIEKGDQDSCDNYAFYIYNRQAGFEFSKGFAGPGSCNGEWVGWNETAAQLNTGTWYHVAVVYDHDAGTVTFYRNGQQSGFHSGFSERIIASDKPVRIGRQSWTETYNGNWGNFHGGMDELGMWKRALTSGEIQQFYRRGLYRLDIKVRGCADSTCSTNPGWLGPDGTVNSDFYTYFLDNGSMVSELPVLGVDSKRYFQYRVNFTAPDQLTSPLLQALSVSSFDTSNPTLELTASSRTFDTLSGFSELVESDHIGDVKYQVSVDGTNWYFHNGTTWQLTTNGFSDSNFATQVNANAATIASVIGPGTFYYKAYFNRSPGAGFIKLKGVRVIGTKHH